MASSGKGTSVGRADERSGDNTNLESTTIGTALDVERVPFYFESETQSLFAWVHRPVHVRSTHGIVICSPLGHEQVHAHRTLRHLADRLAANGLVAMRFDYHGTGDSDGSDRDPQRLRTWLANIRDAAAWLGEQAGCQRVSMIGLRMGASLAVLHAEQQEVDHLVLWEPVVKGRRYVRELTALSQTAKLASDADASGLEAVGFLYSDETADELTELDLTKHSPRFKSCLIVRNDEGSKDTVLLDHLLRLGPSEQAAMPGYADMMAEPQFTKLPETALTSVTDWMVSRCQRREDGDSLKIAFTSSMMTRGAIGVREEIHRISVSPDLIGVASLPLDDARKKPWIILLNGGAAYRIGPGRMNVEMTRHLAGLGYPCLRMDLCGLGDSVIDDVREENDTYPSTAFRDVALTCDYLQTLTPGRSMLVMGLCSGAYTAFQSMVQLPHSLLVEGIMLNPLTFFWRAGMSLSTSPTQQLQAWHYYRKIIFDWNNWRQLFSSSNESGVRGAIHRFFQRIRPKTDGGAKASSQVQREGAYAAYGHPPADDLKKDLKLIAGTTRKLAMFVSDRDPGCFLLMYKAGRRAKQMIRRGQLSCFTIPNADHTFSTVPSRQALLSALTEYLAGR